MRLRIDALARMRTLVALPRQQDITARQWSVLERQLNVVVDRLRSDLDGTVNRPVSQLTERRAACALNAKLGRMEFDLTKAFTFFDTYVDVLTQRASPVLGGLLAGCDVLAWDALKKDHPALDRVEPPLVHCDRGFGASILREGVRLPGAAPNPIPLIQIPYAKLKEKYNLTSVHHEVGHQALSRTGLQSAIPNAFCAALKRAGASQTLQRLYALWSSEIGPDFWAFCCTGLAQPAAIREILSLSPGDAMRVSDSDPHPPPYLRVLLSFEWTRQLWGRGDWDTWERDWEVCYSMKEASPDSRKVLEEAKIYLPIVSSTLLNTKFRVLEGRAIPDLFDMSVLAPWKLRAVADTAKSGCLNLTGLSPSVQLAVFRVVRERSPLTEDALNGVMSKWLIKLGQQRDVWN